MKVHVFYFGSILGPSISLPCDGDGCEWCASGFVQSDPPYKVPQNLLDTLDGFGKLPPA
jgi:hypothetical protein